MSKEADKLMDISLVSNYNMFGVMFVIRDEAFVLRTCRRCCLYNFLEKSKNLHSRSQALGLKHSILTTFVG